MSTATSSGTSTFVPLASVCVPRVRYPPTSPPGSVVLLVGRAEEELMSADSASGDLPTQTSHRSDVTVRPLAEDDGDALAAFGSALPEDDWLYLDMDLQSQQTVERLVRAHEATNWRQIVAVIGDEVVGYANVRGLAGVAGPCRGRASGDQSRASSTRSRCPAGAVDHRRRRPARGGQAGPGDGRGAELRAPDLRAAGFSAGGAVAGSGPRPAGSAAQLAGPGLPLARPTGCMTG